MVSGVPQRLLLQAVRAPGPLHLLCNGVRHRKVQVATVDPFQGGDLDDGLLRTQRLATFFIWILSKAGVSTAERVRSAASLSPGHPRVRGCPGLDALPTPAGPSARGCRRFGRFGTLRDASGRFGTLRDALGRLRLLGVSSSAVKAFLANGGQPEEITERLGHWDPQLTSPKSLRMLRGIDPPRLRCNASLSPTGSQARLKLVHGTHVINRFTKCKFTKGALCPHVQELSWAKMGSASLPQLHALAGCG